MNSQKSVIVLPVFIASIMPLVGSLAFAQYVAVIMLIFLLLVDANDYAHQDGPSVTLAMRVKCPFYYHAKLSVPNFCPTKTVRPELVLSLS